VTRKRTFAQKEAERRYWRRNLPRLNAKKRRYRERLKADPERLAKHRASRNAYYQQWQAGRKRIAVFSLKKWDFVRKWEWRLSAPLPRIEPDGQFWLVE